ncbi:hypothetical protein BDF14DRAFT_176009 [Spinellus fusiger]|nr:hypothetical protein BDF14DRAFT_176009 [Spinellus fusiger]
MESSSLRKVQPHPRHTSTQAQCPPTLHEHHTHTTSLTIPETQLLPVCPINKRHSDELAPLLFCKRFYHPPAPPSLVKSVYKSTVGSIPAPSKSAIDTVGTIGSLTKAPLHSTTDNETSRFEAMLGHLNALQLSQTLSLPSLPSLPSLYSQHPTQFLRKKRVFERYFQHDTEQVSRWEECCLCLYSSQGRRCLSCTL